jgi:hypothetical protein
MGRRLRGGASTRGGRGRGRGQSASATSRAKDSTTPAAEPKGPPVKLKINMSIGRGQQSAARPSVIDFDQLHEQQAEEDEEEELPVAEPADGARRSGRDRKPPKLDDYYVGSEMEDQFTSSAPKADGDDNYESSPPARKWRGSALTLHRNCMLTKNSRYRPVPPATRTACVISQAPPLSQVQLQTLPSPSHRALRYL